MNSMNILFVCRFLPHDRARDSGRLDTYRYIEGLSRYHSVSLISYVAPEEESYVSALTPVCDSVVSVEYHENRLLDRLIRLGYRQLMSRVYGRVFSFKYKNALQKLMRENRFDVVVLDGMMGLYGRWVGDAKIILDEVDIFSHMAYQEYLQQPSGRLRWHRWQDWLHTTHKENLFVRQADGVWVRSEKDKMIIQDLNPAKSVHVIQPWFEGLDTLKELKVERPAGNKILFMGAMNLPSNIQAATFFAQQVLPKVQAAIPDAQFYIVGSRPAQQITDLAAENPAVIVTGEVDDLTPYYEQCAVCVVPLFVGGGIIVKTLNALAAGRPVIATHLGNSGTGAIAGRDILVADADPDAFAQPVIDLLQDLEQWSSVANNGRNHIQNNFNWDQAIERLNQFVSGM